MLRRLVLLPAAAAAVSASRSFRRGPEDSLLPEFPEFGGPSNATAALGSLAAGLSFRQPDDPCACMPWHYAYTQVPKNQCGFGLEYYVVNDIPNLTRITGYDWWLANKNHGEQFCKTFFERLDGNTCANRNIGEDQGTWCYVSMACEQLNGGSRAEANKKNIKWKYCDEHDMQLRLNSPPDLVKLSKRRDVDLAMLHKYSYPMHNSLWGDVEAFFGPSPKSGLLSNETRMDLERIVKSNKPISFDTSVSKAPPHMIVWGSKVYSVTTSDDAQSDKPGTWQNLKCVSGCEVPEV